MPPPLFSNVWGTPTFVLDVTVPLRWLIVSRGNQSTSRVLSMASSNTVAVPNGWAGLIADRLRGEELAGSVTAVRVDHFLVQLRSFSILVDPAGEQVWDVALQIARAHQLPLREAELLELSLRMRLPLASDDLPLTSAAVACGVPIFKP